MPCFVCAAVHRMIVVPLVSKSGTRMQSILLLQRSWLQASKPKMGGSGGPVRTYGEQFYDPKFQLTMQGRPKKKHAINFYRPLR